MAEFLNARPNLIVSDVATSIAFYRDVLGFDVEATMGDPPDFALLRREGAEIALVAGAGTPSGCYIYVTDIDDVHATIVDRTPIVVPPETHPWGTRDFVVRDPDGHNIAIGERLRSK